jgi:NlpC/P60 family putative phage cell wall peptidase
MIARAAILAEARSWIGTPYLHQSSLKGVGCDCLGLALGVYATLVGPPEEAPPPYGPSWVEASGPRDLLLEAARRRLVERVDGLWRAGDVLAFRYRPDAPAKHLAIAAGLDAMIHACDGAAVAETAIGRWWRRRIAGVFSFPGVVDP